MSRRSILGVHLAWCWIALWLFSAELAAQGGYATQKHPELGLEFPMARDYEPIPTQPDAEWVVLYYSEKLRKSPEEQRSFRPQLSFVWIDWVPDAAPVSGAGAEPPAPVPPGAGAEDPPKQPQAPSLPPLNSVERYVERNMIGWEILERRAGKKRGELQAEEAQLTFVESASAPRGWLYWWKAPGKTIALLGLCAPEDYDQQSRIWRNIGERVLISEPEGQDLASLERMYEHTELRGKDFRIQVRSKLVRGWKAEDTENFIVLYDTKDQPLIRMIKDELEAIREEYVKVFPPAAPVEAVSAVRVCKDAAEYYQYGGPRGSGGYWNDQTQELVFYDYENIDGKKGTGKANSRIVLYHEAFHQYIYYSVGELAPHSWFNEGTGDYFSGAQIRAGKVRKIDVNPWRVGYIKEMLRREQTVPWKDILSFEQAEYYRPDRIGLCYAQGWSMNYFLRESREVRRRADWNSILATYFDVLKSSWAIEAKGLLQGTSEAAREGRAEAQKRARQAALDAAFKGVDLAELEATWKRFVAAIEEPK